MNLQETLTLIAAQIKCDAKQLIEFAAEDTIGGYHIDPAQAKWKQGSCWAEEGQTLYALVRLLKPAIVAEIGGWVGCSGSHLAAAVLKNGVGHVYSVDNQVGGQIHAADMPFEYRDIVTLVNEDGRIWLADQPPESIGLLFEDADHSTGLVTELTRLALNKIEAGGILVNHDAAHDFAIVGGGQIINSDVGRNVRDGLAAANAYFRTYRAEPSDCGLAITVIPGERKDQDPVIPMSQRVSVMEQFGGSNSDAGQGVISEEPQFGANSPRKLAALAALEKEHIGNANIESVSTPPVPIETTSDPEVAKKPRKARKPKAQ